MEINKYIREKKADIVKKWSPIIESLGIKNKKILELICIWCEQEAIKDNDNKLPEKLKKLLSSLDSIKKVKVVNTFYNPVTNSLEYELENGTILDKNFDFKWEPTDSELIAVFGIDFIRELDPEAFRDIQLNKIIG